MIIFPEAAFAAEEYFLTVTEDGIDVYVLGAEDDVGVAAVVRNLPGEEAVVGQAPDIIHVIVIQVGDIVA